MTNIAAILALVISFVAAFITYWQTKLVRHSIESQTFITLLERAREIEMSSVLDFISTLKYSKYSTFQKSVPEERQAEIRAVVDFYNDLSHMIRSKYIDDFFPIRLYFPGLLLCNKKLLPWWLDGIRAIRGPSVYENFVWLCQYASFLESNKTRRKLPALPRIGYLKYLKSQRSTITAK